MTSIVDPPGVSPELLGQIAARYGTPRTAILPFVGLDSDHTAAFEDLRNQIQMADVVLFSRVAAANLDGFFYLRLSQILRWEPPLPALSVVVLGQGPEKAKLPAGFASRFRSSWPFAECVFLTENSDAEALSAQLGLPVGSPLTPPTPLRPVAGASQKIALQLQRIWGRCGGTTGFENQIESLVGAGYLTIRLFTDAVQRRGATLNAQMAQVLPENSGHAGAHINVLAVPEGPPIPIRTKDPDEAWATWLAATALCRVRDSLVTEAAKRADVVIGNHIESVGPAIALAPRAKLLLDIRDDRARATRQLMLRNDRNEADIQIGEAAATLAQARVLAIPDICGHVSWSEFKRLAPQSRRSAILLPRVYANTAAPAPPRYDVLVFGDDHPFNATSTKWFVDEVWRPHLAREAVSVAVAGRVGKHFDQGGKAMRSPLLIVLGFVEDLDALRSVCRLTVVPDRHGTGTAVKMLATLAAGHPLVSTSVGVRGLDPSVSEILPAHDEPVSIASDILALLRNPSRLMERRRLVQRMNAAIHRGLDHAALLGSIPRPTPRERSERQARWAHLTGAAIQADPSPFCFCPDATFPMSGCAWDHQVLLEGWHAAEPWGRWTDGAEASMRITLPTPATETLTLELDLVPSPVGATLTLTIDDTALPPITPVEGNNKWQIPPDITGAKSSFVLTLRVSEVVRPADTSISGDHRILGIGVSAVRLRERKRALYLLGQRHPVNAMTAAEDNIMLAGWHAPEDWGCWSNSPSATLELILHARSPGRLLLELDIAPSPAWPILTVSINDHGFQAITPVDGGNQWVVPESATEGTNRVSVTLAVSRTIRPADTDRSADARTLGVGLRGLTVIGLGP